jgi:hypothetical protein
MLKKVRQINDNNRPLYVGLTVLVLLTAIVAIVITVTRKTSTPVPVTENVSITSTMNASELEAFTKLKKSLDRDISAIKPKIYVISKVDEVKAVNPIFYKDIVYGDALIVYPDAIFIMRVNEEKVINYAKILPGTADTILRYEDTLLKQ